MSYGGRSFARLSSPFAGRNDAETRPSRARLVPPVGATKASPVARPPVAVTAEQKSWTLISISSAFRALPPAAPPPRAFQDRESLDVSMISDFQEVFSDAISDARAAAARINGMEWSN